jgi:hypothetical protein
MWRYVAESVQGAHHVVDGTPCQDASQVRVLSKGADTALVACSADGAGSAKHSAIGAELACKSIIECAATFFEEVGSFKNLTAEAVLSWCDSARLAVCDFAESRGHFVREYASTLCAAIISNDRSVFVHIGDGAIVVCRANVYGIVFWPQSGEYINTTNFLTSVDYRDQLQTCEVDGGFSDVALLTDGIERLALRFDSLTAHTPFFKPLFGALRAAQDLEALTQDLRGFLQSKSIQEKSDDDKTLILASWIGAGG